MSQVVFSSRCLDPGWRLPTNLAGYSKPAGASPVIGMHYGRIPRTTPVTDAPRHSVSAAMHTSHNSVRRRRFRVMSLGSGITSRLCHTIKTDRLVSERHRRWGGRTVLCSAIFRSNVLALILFNRNAYETEVEQEDLENARCARTK